MPNAISFTDFHITRSGFSCTVRSSLRDMQADRLDFRLEPRKGKPDPDAIACTLSTITGTQYSDVHLELPISRSLREDLEKFTKAQWRCPDPKPETALSRLRSKAAALFRPRTPAPRIMLNFSGGFDSLAAYALMPREHTHLVAVDFGGWFQRETDYFVGFRPNILHTNFRKLNYDRASWTFMGTGSLLFAKQLRADYIAFGSILEASVYNVRESNATTVRTSVQPFSLLGLKSVEYVRGLTEVGTAMVVTHFFPEQVRKSLASLAADGSEKRYRKQVLTEIVCRRFGRDLDLPACNVPEEKVILPFGKNFALDFLALYELKHAGPEIVAHTVSSIPQEAVRLSQELSLEFYEKLNPWYLPTIPEELRENYLQKLKAAGIEPYTEKDWAKFRQVRDYLASIGHK